MMTECNICTEKYNKITRKCVTCPKCNFQCCRDCVEKYVSSNQNEIHCMSCKSGWEYEYILETMTKAGMKRIDSSLQNIWFEKEKAKLPETQQYVSYQKKIDEYTEMVAMLYSDYDSTLSLYNTVKDTHKKMMQNALSLGDNNLKMMCKKFQDKCTEMKDDLQSYSDEISKYTKKINKWKDSFSMGENNSNKSEEKKTLKVISNCTEDSCKGFIMSNWKCGLCETTFCAKCHIKKDKTHVCNEDDIKTAEMITKSTKPCPCCATLIHKISGCSQMWCPSCKTVFDYNTCKIDNGIIHNPHYYEWFKNNATATNINAEQINCNRNINQQQLMAHIKVAFQKINPTIYKTLMYYNRLIGHIRYLMNNTVFDNENDEKYNLDLRIDWMMNKITEGEFKQKLRLRYKRNKFLQNKKQIYDMVQRIMNDISHKVLYCNNEQQANDLISEYTEILKYGNVCMLNIGKMYNYKVYEIK